MLLPYAEVCVGSDSKAAVIWLHGLGDTGHGFASLVPEFKLPETSGIRFIFPHAPEIRLSMYQNMQARAWFEPKSNVIADRADPADVMVSAQQIEALIEQEIARGIPANKIVLAGFSQGGVVALHLAARTTHKLAGIIALSTYLCDADRFVEQATEHNKQTPFFVGHGTHDETVPCVAGDQAQQVLTAAGYPVEWKTYPIQHNLCAEEVADVAVRLQQFLG